MVILNPEDYEKLAQEISCGFLDGAVPLNDGVYKVASTMGLNPDQIKTLVWSTNTACHLALFQKQAEDKMIEFPVADANYVVQRLYTPAEEQPLPAYGSAKTAEDFSTPLVAETAKEAAAIEYTKIEDKPLSETSAAARKAKKIMAMRKVATELEQTTLASREMYREALAKLAQEMRKLGSDHTNFEMDVYAAYGERAVPALHDLRVYMNYKEALDTSKIACEYDRVVDTSDKHIKTFTSVLGHFEDTVKTARARVWLDEQIGELL